MCKIHAVLVSAFLLAGSASATSIFFTDFDSGEPSQISGSSGVASTAAVNGNAGIDGLQVWQDYSTGNPNSPTTLTLTGLAANQSLNLDFNFLAIGSWDGTTEGAAAPTSSMSLSIPTRFSRERSGITVLRVPSIQAAQWARTAHPRSIQH